MWGYTSTPLSAFLLGGSNYVYLQFVVGLITKLATNTH